MNDTAGNDAPVIALRGVSKSYGGRTVIDRLDLDIRHGEFLTLLGPSGCGKTTVLRLIAGFERADTGSVHIAGRDVGALPPEARAVNTVFQSYALFPHLNVQDNVAFGLRMRKLPADEISARVAEALAGVQLQDLARRRPHELSGGQQQRVALARALVNRPLVLLLDESLSALDYRLRKEMQLELKALQRRLGITFVFVTHDQEEALAMSDRVVLLDQGRVAQAGPPREIYERPANLFVARFVGEGNLFPADVIDHTGGLVDILGTRCRVRLDARHGPRVHVLVRPEDMRIHRPGAPLPDDQPSFTGRIVERTYKGMTLDSLIRLDNGMQVIASEFFDEDAPDLDHAIGEPVRVGWVPDWETVLPWEDDATTGAAR